MFVYSNVMRLKKMIKSNATTNRLLYVEHLQDLVRNSKHTLMRWWKSLSTKSEVMCSNLVRKSKCQRERGGSKGWSICEWEGWMAGDEWWKGWHNDKMSFNGVKKGRGEVEDTNQPEWRRRRRSEGPWGLKVGQRDLTKNDAFFVLYNFFVFYKKK